MDRRVVLWALGAYGVLAVVLSGIATAARYQPGGWFAYAPTTDESYVPPGFARAAAAHDAHVVLACALLPHATGAAIQWQQVAIRAAFALHAVPVVVAVAVAVGISLRRRGRPA